MILEATFTVHSSDFLTEYRLVSRPDKRKGITDTRACGADPWAFKPHVDAVYVKRQSRYHGLTATAGHPRAALPPQQLCEGETSGFSSWKARELLLLILILQTVHKNQPSPNLRPLWRARAHQKDWQSQISQPDHQPHSTKLKISET